MGSYNLPIGVRFRPTRVQLVTYFLATRLNNGALPPYYPQLIDCDVYTDHPFNILASTKQLRGVNDLEQGFFFSRLNKSTPNGKRISRRIQGHGTWLENSKTHQLYFNNNAVGSEKYFTFVPVVGNRDEWRMHEYYLAGNDEMVLCHITKKPDSTDDRNERSKGMKRGRTIYAQNTALDIEGSTSKQGRIEYVQDYATQVLPLAYDNSGLDTTKKDALSELKAMLFDDNDWDDDNNNTDNNNINNQQVIIINEDAQEGQLLEAAEKSSSLPLLPSGAAREGDDKFDIDEFVEGLLLPNEEEDIGLNGSWAAIQQYLMAT